MKSIHVMVFCFVGIISFAQVRFEAAYNSCKIEESHVVKGADYYCHNRIINKVNESQEIMWSKENVTIPIGWASYVCDNNNCYTPKITACPEKLPNILLVDSVVNMDVHYDTDGIQGGAHVVLWVFEKGDTAHRLRIDYLFNIVLSNQELKHISIKMYPNPTANTFTVESNVQLTHLELIDVLGKKVARYSADQFKTYDISHLYDGIYLVKLLDSNKQYISTLRFQKQSPRI